MVAIHSMLASLRDSMSVCGTLFVPVAPPLVLRPADTAFFVALPVGTPEYQPYLRHHCCLGACSYIYHSRFSNDGFSMGNDLRL